MFDVKTNIITALNADATLTTLLGGQRFYWQTVPDSLAGQFPRVTFFEVSNRPADYGDNAEQGSEIQFQFDVWAKGADPTAIAQQLDICLKAAGWWRLMATDMYEDDTRIFHKVTRYVILK